MTILGLLEFYKVTVIGVFFLTLLANFLVYNDLAIVPRLMTAVVVAFMTAILWPIVLVVFLLQIIADILD